MKSLVKWVYDHYRQYIYDLLIEDFYGYIPTSLKQPTLEFLANGKEKLERTWSIQAYQLQRRSIMDNKNADVYKGMLVILRAQMIALDSYGKVKHEPASKGETATPVESNPVSDVEDFVKKGKARFGDASDNTKINT